MPDLGIYLIQNLVMYLPVNILTWQIFIVMLVSLITLIAYPFSQNASSFAFELLHVDI